MNLLHRQQGGQTSCVQSLQPFTGRDACEVGFRGLGFGGLSGAGGCLQWGFRAGEPSGIFF